MNHKRTLRVLALFILISDGFAKKKSSKKTSNSNTSNPGMTCVDNNPSQTSPCSTEKTSLKVGIIIGIVIGCLAVFIILALSIWFYLRRRRERLKTMTFEPSGSKQKYERITDSDLNELKLKLNIK